MASSRSSAALADGELDVAVTLGRPRGIGAERLVSVPVGHDHLVAVVGSGHPYAGLRSVAVAQLLHQPLIVASGEDEPAVAAGLRALLGEGSPALSCDGRPRRAHCHRPRRLRGRGGPRALPDAGGASPRHLVLRGHPAHPAPGPGAPLPPEDRSPALDAFFDVVRANCPVVGASLDRRPGPRIEAAGRFGP